MLSLDTLKVVLEIGQILVGAAVATALLSFRIGRWTREPVTVVQPKNGNGGSSDGWRPKVDELHLAVAKLQAEIDTATQRRTDLIDENRREHKRFDDALMAITRRIDQHIVDQDIAGNE